MLRDLRLKLQICDTSGVEIYDFYLSFYSCIDFGGQVEETQK